MEKLDTILADYQTLTLVTQRDITLLREYHTRLIADVVTGKLDVRQAAALLPDEQEPPPADESLSDNDPDLDAPEGSPDA